MRRMQKIFFLFLLPILFNPFVVIHLESQEKGVQKELQHEVAVILKLIQVYVTDEEGNPVTDLKKDDFTLWDNEELKKITDFETHFTILTKQVPAPAQVVKKPEESGLSPPSIQLNRKFFLFLDIQRNDPVGVLKSKRVARYFIETQIQSGDEVGVFSFQPTVGFVLHEYLTSEKEKMLTAIKKARSLPGHSLFPMETSVGAPTWESYVKPLNVFFYALEDLSQSLQYVSGIKNIILFSNGAGAKTIFDRLGKILASSNCRVYTVDTNWKRHYLKGYFESGLGSGLKQLALSSGGKHFEDPDDFVTIAEDIHQMTGNYYVLGYYIQQDWDGQYHETKVEVKREGYVVYAQKGYFNPKPFSEFSEGEKKLHLADIAMNDIPYFEAPKPFSLEALPILGIEVSKLVLLSEIQPVNLEEVFLNDSEIITLIMDDEENIIEARRAVLKYETIKQTPIHHYSITRLNSGLYKCRVVVRNLETGKSALGTSSVKVPEIKESEIQIYPLFLQIPDKESFYVRAVREIEEQEKEALSLNDIYPYLSKNHSPLVTEVDRSEKRLLAILRFSADIPGKKPLDVMAELTHSPSGRKIPIESLILDSKKFGLDDTFLLELGLPFVEPDIYTLSITLSDPQSGLEATASRTFRIR